METVSHLDDTKKEIFLQVHKMNASIFTSIFYLFTFDVPSHEYDFKIAVWSVFPYFIAFELDSILNRVL